MAHPSVPNGTEFSSTGLVNGDTISQVGLVSAGTPATATVVDSPYSIVPSNAIGTGLGNYTISYAPGLLSVGPATLTLIALNQSKVYGDTLNFNGNEFSSIGLLNGDIITGANLTSAGTLATAGVAAAPYTIAASNAIGSRLANYTIVYVPGTLAVTPAPLTLKALDQSKVYGVSLAFAGTEFSAAGLRNGETITSVDLLSTGSSPTAGVAAGPYPITIGKTPGKRL